MYITLFHTARKEDIADDLQAFSFLRNGTSDKFLQHVRIAKFFLPCTTAQLFVEVEATYDFCITHLQDWTPLSSLSATVVLLLQVAHRYVISPERLKGAFPANTIYSASARYLNALHALFNAIRHANFRRWRFPRTFDELHAFLQCELSKTKTETTTGLDVIFKHMPVLQFDT